MTPEAALNQILTVQIFAFLLLFVRIGAMMMTLPGFGEGFVSARFRLAIALAVAFVLTPVLQARLPPTPADIGALFLLIALEALIGVAIGMAARLLMSALNVAGNIIAMQTGLGFALSVDPGQGSQGAILSTFLVMLGITLIFSSGAHQLFFAAIVHSYDLFKPGAAVSAADFLELVTGFVSSSFSLAVALSAPFLILGLVFYAGLGVVSKLMPQFQVFFISLPLSIMGGFAIMMLLLSMMMTIFLDRFSESFSVFSG